jgi:hypothetical protein
VLDSSQSDRGARLIPLASFTDAIRDTSAKHGLAFKPNSSTSSTEIRELERLRRVTSDPAERATLTKLIWKARREVKRQNSQQNALSLAKTGKAREWRRLTQEKPTVTSLDGEVDRNQWPECISDHFRETFCKASPEATFWRKGLKTRLEERAQAFSRDPKLKVVFSAEEVQSAIDRLSNGKTVPEDGVSSEMLKALDKDAVLLLAVSLSAKASGARDVTHSWRELTAVLIPKINRVKRVADLRPITIVPTLKKLYSLLLLSKASPQLEEKLSPWNMGCRKSFQALEAVSCLRWAVERSREWQLPLYVAKLDFKKAFDSLSQASLEKTLVDAGVDQDVVLSILEEISEVHVSFTFQGVTSKPLLLLTGVPQGDPSSPLYFCSTVDRLVKPLVSKWKQAGLGFTLDEGASLHLPLLAWMDDLYLLATSARHLESMTRDVCNAFTPAGLTLQPTKCRWSTTQQDCIETVTAMGKLIPMAPAASGLEVLGTTVSFLGDSDLELDSRLAKAWRSYWANYGLLSNPRAHPSQRVRLFNSVVTPTALWAVGSLSPTTKSVDRFDTTMRGMVARILRVRRKAQEGWLPWFKRSRREANTFLREARVPRWGTLLLKRVFTWGGHVSRLPNNRVCKSLMRWRDLEWWRHRQALIALGFPDLTHPQGRFGFPRRWETPFEKFADSLADIDGGTRDWHLRSQDRELWAEAVDWYLDIP